MDNNITNTSSGAISLEYQQAVSLHRSIMANAQTAADAMIEFCKGLKQMRDSKLYAELGYESFEDYTVHAVGLKQRQAYSYISTYERLGQTFLQSNAMLGITKLEMLAAVPSLDRDEVLEDNDIENMTAAEVKALVAKLTAAQEQLSLLQADADEAERERRELEDELCAAKAQIAALPAGVKIEGNEPDGFDQYINERERLLERITELEEALNEPVEASEEAVAKIRAEETARAEKEAAQKIWQIEKETKEKIKAAKDKAKADADAAVKAAEEKAQKELAEARRSAEEAAKKQEKERLQVIEQEKAAAVARAQELEDKLRAAANSATVKVGIYMESMQSAFFSALDLVGQEEQTTPETAERLRAGMRKLMQMLMDKI